MTYKDLAIAAQFEAAIKSVNWIYQHAHDAVMFDERFGVTSYALAEAPAGMIAEFGVYQGGMTKHIRKLRPQSDYHAFDSWHGVPGVAPFAIAPNSFDLGGKVPPLPPGVVVHSGLFEDTVPEFVRGARPIAFAFIDCDLYTGVSCVLQNIEPLLLEGAVVVFDDFYNFPNWEAHSYRAMRECCTITFEAFAVATKAHTVAFRVSR